MASLRELRAMETQELLREAEALWRSLQKTRIEIALSKEKNTSKCRRFQREHARICAILREKNPQNEGKNGKLQMRNKSRMISSSSL